MGATEIIMMITFGGSILGIVGFVIGNTRSEAEKRARLYIKFDEEREKSEKTFVRQDICGVHHKYIADTLKNIDLKLDKVLKQNGK